MKSQHITFDNEESFESKINTMNDQLKLKIIQYMTTDTAEYEHMQYFGLTPRQSCTISDIIFAELQLLSNYTLIDWCYEISTEIMTGISAFMNGLVEINRVSTFTPYEYAILIYNSIIKQLDTLIICVY